MDDDGWSEHQCINLKSCLESLPQYSGRELLDFRFRWIQFSGRDNFWIDEFMLLTGLQTPGGEHLILVIILLYSPECYCT